MLEIENDFKLKIQEYVSKLDSDKAALLATLEKELNVRQEQILESARRRIDELNDEANRLKMVSSSRARKRLERLFSRFRVSSKKLKPKATLKSVRSPRMAESLSIIVLLSPRSNH